MWYTNYTSTEFVLCVCVFFFLGHHWKISQVTDWEKIFEIYIIIEGLELRIYIHSSIDEQLNCFHVLATVSCAALNISVTVPFLNLCLTTLEKGHFLMLLLIMSALSLSFLLTVDLSILRKILFFSRCCLMSGKL